MSVEFQYLCYVLSDEPQTIERGLSELKKASQESFEVDWAIDGNTINFMVIGSSTDIVEKWSGFYKKAKDDLSKADEYVLWCYCDHDDFGLPVLAKIGGRNYVGNLEVRDYFALKKEVPEEKFNDHTREIGKRLGSGRMKLGNLEDERLREEYGML